MDPDLAAGRTDSQPATSWGSFREDVRASLRAWREYPGLPITTLLLVGMLEVLFARGEDSPAAALASLPLLVFLAGFMGTQRVWYRRAFNGELLAGGEIWSSAWRFAPRFIRFGLLTCLLTAFPVSLAVGFTSGWAEWVVLVGAWFAIDVWTTFATPALAYSTRRTRKALAISWWFVSWRWQQIRWHALVPPLVVILGVRTMPALSESVWIVSGVSVLGWMLNLLFKGAQARAYLEHYHADPEPPKAKKAKKAKKAERDRALASQFGQGSWSSP